MNVVSNALQPRVTLVSIATVVGAFTLLTLLMDPSHFNGLDDETSLAQRLVNRLYYVMATVSTVGYGDVSPKTPLAKLVGVAIMTTMLSSVVL